MPDASDARCSFELQICIGRILTSTTHEVVGLRVVIIAGISYNSHLHLSILYNQGFWLPIGSRCKSFASCARVRVQIAA